MSGPNTTPSEGSWSFLRTQWMGTLPGTAATRRYESRITRSLLALFILGGVNGIFSLPPFKHLQPWMAPVNIAAAAVFAAYLAKCFLAMLREADELERRIHLEAIAVAFVAAVGASIVLGAVYLFYGWTINPIWFYCVELLRGLMVGIKSRQFNRD